MRGLAVSTMLVVIAASGCLAKRNDGATSDVRIFNGSPVTSSDDLTMRSTVSLLIGGQQSFCSGVVMDKNIVVSAAHCFSGMESQMAEAGVSIGFGAGPVYDAVLPVETVFIHDGYSLQAIAEAASEKYKQTDPTGYARFEELTTKKAAGGLTGSEETEYDNLRKAVFAVIGPYMSEPNIAVHDISVMKFTGTAPSYATDVNPTGDIVANQQAIAAGYGLTGTNPQGGNGVLYRVSLNVKKENAAAEELIVKGNGSTGTCKGDSGGPLYVQQGNVLTVIGLVSRGTEAYPACGGDSTVYTDVRTHLQWLTCHAGELMGNTQMCGNGEAGVKRIDIVGNGGGNGGGGNNGGGNGLEGGCLNTTEAVALLLCAAASGQLGPAEQAQCTILLQRYSTYGECVDGGGNGGGNGNGGGSGGGGNGGGGNGGGNGGSTVNGQLCGKATQNTSVCINAQRTAVTVYSKPTQQQTTYEVTAVGASQTFPGATGYAGIANLSFIAGLTPATQVSFLIHPNGTARLVYLTFQGWVPFGGVQTPFTLAPNL